MIQKIILRFLPLLVVITCQQLTARIVSIKNNEDFETIVIKNNQPVILKFAAEWCGVCTTTQEDFEKVAKEKEFKNIIFAQINMSDFPKISKKYGIIGVPTFVYFKDGNVLGQDVGVQNIDDFKPELRSNIKKKFDPSYPSPKKILTQKANTFLAMLQNWFNQTKITIKGWFTS